MAAQKAVIGDIAKEHKLHHVQTEEKNPLPDQAGNTQTEDSDRFHHQSINFNMSLIVRKPVLGVSDQVRHKRGYTAIEDG